MGLLTRKRKANRLTDIEVDEISLVEKEANQHSKVVLWKSVDGPPDDDDQDDEGWEIQLEDGTWVHEDDLSDEEIEAVIEAWDDLEEFDAVEGDGDDEDDDDEFIEEDEDTHDGIEDEEPLPAMSKLSKAAEVDSTLSRVASENIIKMVDEAAEDIVAIDDRYVSRPRSERDSIRRVMVMKDNPDVYEDYRELRRAGVGAVAKAQGAQEQTAALMASVSRRAASLSKSDEGMGLTPAQARAKVIRDDPEIAKAYRAIQFERVRAS